MEKGVLKIEGIFSDDEILNSNKLAGDVRNIRPKHQLRDNHPGFDLVSVPSGDVYKIAYGKLYPEKAEDLEIELDFIQYYETRLLIDRGSTIKDAREKLCYHYKRCIEIISPRYASGWNRWSEDILKLFVSEKTHKIVWGSGNCGKSAVCALLLYIKWRANPTERMLVIASSVLSESNARVIGYIMQIHKDAPPSSVYKFKTVKNKSETAIYTLMYLKDEGKWIPKTNGCIVSLPIKTKITASGESETGSNLMGSHPEDRLMFAFDEGQEILGDLLESSVFSNWLTNERLDIYAWGNPRPIDWNAPETWDMLFKLGARKLSLEALKSWEKKASKTTRWGWDDTEVLHLSMLDSPKDDEDEIGAYVQDGTVRRHRLSFLAGKVNADNIAANTSPTSISWYAQVLGFPYIETDGGRASQGVLNPHIVKESRNYPLIWRDTGLTGGGRGARFKGFQWFMGVDPSVSGRADKCAIVVARLGEMQDGRWGLDLMNGKYCKNVSLIEDEEFMDTTIDEIHRLSVQLGIPLSNIAIETHGCGDVLRYAIMNHIETKGKWRADASRGQSFYTVSPVISPTERYLFKSLGNILKSKDMCSDIITEYWVAARCAFMTRQVFNVPSKIIEQFYSRLLFTSGSSAKYKVESKKDMAKRGVHSPDDADAFCNMLEVARERGGFNFRYLNTGKYSAKYGEVYDIAQETKIVERRMKTILEDMFGISRNFGGFELGKGKRNGRGGNFGL